MSCCITLKSYIKAVMILQFYPSAIKSIGSPPVAEAYTRFQDITWQLIPEGSEWANVMGFNVMCRPSKKIRDGMGEWEEIRDFVFSCGSDGGKDSLL